MSGILAGGMVLAPLMLTFTETAASAAPGKSQRCKKPYHKDGRPKKHCFPGVDNSNPKKGDNVTISGDGQESSSDVSATLHSLPFKLGTATADGDGAFSLTGTIPCDTPAGDHTITVDGTGDDGAAVTDTIAIVVQNASASNCATVLGTTATPSSGSTTAAGETARGTTSSNLPFTGSAATVMLLTLAVGLIGAGSLAVVAARRRRSTTTVA